MLDCSDSVLHQLLLDQIYITKLTISRVYRNRVPKCDKSNKCWYVYQISIICWEIEANDDQRVLLWYIYVLQFMLEN